MIGAASERRASTPALVMGSGVHTALGVIRALARVPQFIVGAGTSYVSHCRWHRRLPGQSWDDPTPESLAEFLARLPFERMVLVHDRRDRVVVEIVPVGAPPRPDLARMRASVSDTFELDTELEIRFVAGIEFEPCGKVRLARSPAVAR